MDKKDICIATISWARTDSEEKLLRASLTSLANLRIPTFITDGGSSESFLQFINDIPHFTLLKANEKGVFAQAKNSLNAAFETTAPFVFYTEPDKEIFFQDALPKLIDEVVNNEALGIQLASRSAKGFATFPAFQQMTETTINNCCADVIKKDVDFTYGPFLLNRKLIPFLNAVKEDVGWGWRPYTFVMAHRSGLEITASVDDFTCPTDQRDDDAKERIYRMKQLEQNIRGIVLAANTTIEGK
jgi:hypothetical protein